MINLLTESIGIALDAGFGGTCRIYREEGEQDLEKPCFFISCIYSGEKRIRLDRYARENQFCIRYFPVRDGQENATCCTVAERMFSCLGRLEAGGISVMGTGMKYEISDGILHFFVNYNTVIRRPDSVAAAMEEMKEAVYAKGQVRK